MVRFRGQHHTLSGRNKAILVSEHKYVVLWECGGGILLSGYLGKKWTSDDLKGKVDSSHTNRPLAD